MISPTRIAELAANLRAKWLTEEAKALEQLAEENSTLRVFGKNIRKLPGRLRQEASAAFNHFDRAPTFFEQGLRDGLNETAARVDAYLACTDLTAHESFDAGLVRELLDAELALREIQRSMCAPRSDVTRARARVDAACGALWASEKTSNA
jgi:hypothetical protein